MKRRIPISALIASAILIATITSVCSLALAFNLFCPKTIPMLFIDLMILFLPGGMILSFVIFDLGDHIRTWYIVRQSRTPLTHYLLTRYTPPIHHVGVPTRILLERTELNLYEKVPKKIREKYR